MFKRLALSLLTVGAVAGMVAGGTFALFSDTAENNSNTFTAGTVTLGEPAALACPIQAGGLAPGDDGSCTISVQYTGSLDAWVGFDYAGSGALFDGANPITIDNPSYVDNGGKQVVGKLPTNETANVTLNYHFPAAAGNEYQGAAGTITVNFYAVQARNNTNATNDGPNSWN
ncbi:MAG TPA: TasA family protein [Symbiobacteriaceae bacterium]|jgi:predicted ribosomally synthesized peptide with SipW-like signal peptide|nr:TasA family protein [Symbiobacteriaceae bacterium]